jgi:hypothetical protein
MIDRLYIHNFNLSQQPPQPCVGVLASDDMVTSGLQNAAGLGWVADNLSLTDSEEAAWWFGLMDDGRGQCAVRPLPPRVEVVA